MARRIKGKFFDGTGGYCALGYYLHMLGGTTDELYGNRATSVNLYRKRLGQEDLKHNMLISIVEANDFYDNEVLNYRLEAAGLDFRINESNEWISYAKETSHIS